jgi:nicotinamidase-related amidase
MFHARQMSAGDTGLLVIDVQEKLVPLIVSAQAVVRNIAFLIDAAKVLNMPIQATEQYPKGLGATVPELASRLPPRSEKVAFSCCAIPAVIDGFRSAGRAKVVLAGIETHVCVQQTALDLLALDFQVYIPADAVGSRYVLDHEQALHRLEHAGAVISTSESAVFEWVGMAGTPQFKEISRLVQERMKQLPA